MIKYTDIQTFSFVRRHGSSEVSLFELYGMRYLSEEIGPLAATLDHLRSKAPLENANFVDGFAELQGTRGYQRVREDGSTSISTYLGRITNFPY